jgi:hypothetical protein
MKKTNLLLLAGSYLVAIFVGFALGIYTLPILIAPKVPDNAQVESVAKHRVFKGTFSRDRKDSDFLHWGEGEVSIGPDVIAFKGELAPGPDYKLYFSTEFVETEKDFNRLKPSMLLAGEVKNFKNFIIPLTKDVDPTRFNSIIIWCESFGQFISSARYERQ